MNTLLWVLDHCLLVKKPMRFIKNLLLILTLILVSFGASAVSLPLINVQDVQSGKVTLQSPEVQAWIKLRNSFVNQLRNSEKIIKADELSSDVILKIEKEIGFGAHGAVYKVKTRRGFAALKLYYDFGRDPSDSLEPRDTPSYLIQKILGQLGIAPAIFGRLSSDEVNRFIEMHKIQMSGSLHDKFRYGVVMEFVEGAVNYKSGKLRNYDKVDLKYVKNRFVEIDTTFKYLGIRASDQDFLISHDGKIFVHDFDFYSVFVAATKESFGYGYYSELDPRFPPSFGIINHADFPADYYLQQVIERQSNQRAGFKHVGDVRRKKLELQPF